MALNLKKNERSLLEAWDWLKKSNKVGKWVVFGYEAKTFNLEHVESGDGGLEELNEELSDGRMMYGAVCVKDPNSGLPKIVFIVWQGLGVPETIRGRCAQHVETVMKFFSGYHVNITARDESDVDEKVILDKVRKSSGANYGVHNEKPISPEKPSHPVASYKKIDPSKEISSSEREKFWNQDAKESTEVVAENPSFARAQEVKANRSAAETFKKIEQERIKRERELEQERIKKNQQIQSSIKSSLSEPEAPAVTQTREEEIKSTIPTGKASSFKAMFEQKVEEQSFQKPQPARTAKKWEPVETKPIQSSVPSTIQTRTVEPVPEVSSRSFQQPVLSPPPEPISKPSYQPPASQVQNIVPDEPEVFSSTVTTTPEMPPSIPKKILQVTTFDVIAIYDYDASDDTEISFKMGDKITEVVKDDDEWWTGTNPDGQRGQLPYNFVALEGTPEADEVLQALAEEMEKIEIVEAIGKAKVLYDYEATDTDELSLTENEIVSILEKREDGWWVAQNSKGDTGLIPCNFVEE